MITKTGQSKALLLVILFLAGCAAKQEISRFEASAPKLVCIGEHEAVRHGVLDSIVEGVQLHGSKTRIINATYVNQHNMWVPSINLETAIGCDAILFYVANWTWDITTYMYFANIWVMDSRLSSRLAQATYQTGGGPNKWINAREKILELVDQMYVSVDGKTVDLPTEIAEEEKIEAEIDTSGLSPEERLRKLKEMYEEGLISDDEYSSAKKQVLDEF